MDAPNIPNSVDRLDAWSDGSAICVIAVSAHGDPLDLGENEIENFIDKLRQCLKQAKDQSTVGPLHMPKDQSELSTEAKRATDLLKGKMVSKVWRNHSGELGIQFIDGTRLFVDQNSDQLEISIT
jgi:hypothetical protein